MSAARTITLLEHEFVAVKRDDRLRSESDGEPHWFTDSEADALCRMNGVQPGLCQRVTGGLKFAQYCGVIRLPTCTVELLPKLGMMDHRTAGEADRARGALLIMLHHAQRLRLRKMETVAQHTVRAPLMDIFVTAFLESALMQARRGMLSRYRSHVDDVVALKGRFDASANYLHNTGRPHLLRCEYDEFTTDNRYNRAIRATLDLCRSWARQPTTMRLWHEAHTRFASIPSTRMTAADVAHLPRDRTTRRYELVLEWCERLLAMGSPALKAGTSPAPGLLFDMNKLFEAYVAKTVQSSASDAQVVRTRGESRHMATNGSTNLFLLKPDITVWETREAGLPPKLVRLVDAKWKRINPAKDAWQVSQDDVYQMLAYAVRYGISTVELAYPVPDGRKLDAAAPTFAIQGLGNNNLTTKVRVTLVPIVGTESSLH